MMNFMKDAFQVLLVIWVIGILTKAFLTKTWIGRTIMVIFKSGVQITKFVYLVNYKMYKWISKQVKAQQKKAKQKQPSSTSQKKAAGCENVIQFKPKSKGRS